VDAWHCSSAGLYENQDPSQADMNLRGSFITDKTGTFNFRTVKPVGYPIPIEGNVVGELLRAQNRHNYRPAHVHILIFKPGFKTLISQVFMPDDPHLEDDVQFGVTRALAGNLVRHEGSDTTAQQPGAYWYSMAYTFVVDEGEATRPRPPIK
jgi:protocatechuate 3,4-dioxygenase beta subunit